MSTGKPLSGIRVLEFGGLAPGPFAGLVLADFGADVIRLDRPAAHALTEDVLCRGKRSAGISLKDDRGRDAVLRLYAKADVVIDPYRPGVLERLGLGPEQAARASNGRIVFARLSGFERTGPYSKMAGHDINYIALTGVLSMIKAPGSSAPVPPLNLLADFAGGGLMCALGIVLALFERARSGKGQVVECDMVNGARYVSSFPLLLSGSPLFSGGEDHDTGFLNGSAPWYGVYKCKDEGYMSVGAIEPQFYSELIRLLAPYFPTDRPSPSAKAQHDASTWPDLRRILTDTFATRTRDEWTATFLSTDACAVPVLTTDEVSTTPTPAPQLARTPARAPPEGENEMLEPGRDTEAILLEAGLTKSEILALARDRIVLLGGPRARL